MLQTCNKYPINFYLYLTFQMEVQEETVVDTKPAANLKEVICSHYHA